MILASVNVALGYCRTRMGFKTLMLVGTLTRWHGILACVNFSLCLFMLNADGFYNIHACWHGSALVLVATRLCSEPDIE